MPTIFIKTSYSKQDFSTDAKRLAFLFELYEKYTGGLFAEEKKTKSNK